MFHRHPFLSLLTFAYLGFVGLVTLTPASEQPDYSALAARVLARLERYPDLDRSPPGSAWTGWSSWPTSACSCRWASSCCCCSAPGCGGWRWRAASP